MIINSGIGPQEDYANLIVTLEKPKRSRTTCEVRLEIPGWRYFPPTRVKLDTAALLAVSSDPNLYGQALGKALFAGKALGIPYKETLAAVQGRGDGLRVKLLVDSPDLQEIHWERIFHPIAGEWQPLGSTAVTPFSRYIRPQQWDRPLPVTTRPLSMLVVIASPANLDSGFRLDPVSAEERAWLHHALDQIPDLSVTYLESGTPYPPTLNEIRKQLANGYHFVHFLCHGAKMPAGTGLFLEDDHGQVEPVDQTRLVQAFKVLNTPPVLVFLAACESAKRSREDAMLPLGPALVEDGGIQAVVAMTAKVGLKVAQVFSAQFYARLLNHGLVDLAVNESRALVQDDWDWGVPVLFSRLDDNQLIDFPIGQLYSNYLSHTDTAFVAIDEALNAARLETHGEGLVNDLQDLVSELGKTHAVMVEVANNFRRTGRDPQDFGRRFEDFYYDFKAYYDNQTWVHETTSCQRIEKLKYKVLPKLSPLLDQAHFDQLRQELDLLGNADMDLVRYFGAYLNEMNRAVEDIWRLVEDGKIEEAIQAKRDFEAQISPSFQRSKEMFERMSSGIRGVQAA